MKTFACSYRFDGADHAVHIMAKDEDEAQRRLEAIGAGGKVDGELTLEMALQRALGRMETLRKGIEG